MTGRRSTLLHGSFAEIGQHVPTGQSPTDCWRTWE